MSEKVCSEQSLRTALERGSVNLQSQHTFWNVVANSKSENPPGKEDLGKRWQVSSGRIDVTSERRSF